MKPDLTDISVLSSVDSRVGFSSVHFRLSIWRFGCIILQPARLARGDMASGLAHLLYDTWPSLFLTTQMPRIVEILYFAELHRM